MRKLLFVTGNVGKWREFQRLLGSLFRVTNAHYDLTEIQGTPTEIAIHKAKLAAKQFGQTIVIEDTSVWLKEYGEAMGGYCKWLGVDENGKNDNAEMQCIRFNKMAAGCKDKTLIAKCIIAICSPDCEPMLFVGTFEGECCDLAVGKPTDGSAYFGWDAIMFDKTMNKSFAQMTSDEKNSVSQRKKAVDAFVAYMLNTYQEKNTKQICTNRSSARVLHREEIQIVNCMILYAIIRFCVDAYVCLQYAAYSIISAIGTLL